MAVKSQGSSAPYLFDVETRWCTGSGTGALTSKSFGSCVGLVMWCPSTTVGMVAHFAGSLGNPTKHAKAGDDAKEILLAMYGGAVVTWHAWVFGGTSLATTTSSKGNLGGLDLGTSTVDQTKSLMAIVRGALDADANYTFDYKTEGFPGHFGVSLDLASGAVTFS